MIDIVFENLVTDLKNNGITLSNKALNSVLDYFDIESSFATKESPESWNDIRNKTLIIAEEGDVIGIYRKGKFIYNPKKLKPTNTLNYDVFSVNEGSTDVQRTRELRKQSRSGLISTASGDYPKSLNYVFEKDWDPKYNREYYIKLLQQNKLGMYSVIVDVAYKLCMRLIEHHYDEKTVGKRANVYNEKISKLVSQIKKVEDLIKKIDANFEYTVSDAEKIKQEIKRLDTISKECEYLLKTEDDTIKRFGYAPTRPHTKIYK